MFIPAFMNAFLISNIDEEGDNGGGEEQSYDDGLGVPFEPEIQQDNDQIDPNSSEPKDNPAWQTVFNKLPKEFHEIIRPDLDGWDKNFAEVQSKYAPYKPLVENNVPYEQIQNSIRLAQAIAADPHAIYMELGRRYGFEKEQGQPQVNELEEQEDSDLPDLMEQDDPRIAQLTQTVEKLQQMIQGDFEQKQNIQIRENAQREIDNEWSQLESKVGQLSPDIKKEIIQRSVIIGDQTGNYSLLGGYQDYAALVTRVRNSRANNNAPAVLSGNGGQPVTKKNMGQMSDEERQDHIAAMTKALVEGNGS